MASFIEEQNKRHNDENAYQPIRVKPTYCTNQTKGLIFLGVFVIFVPSFVFFIAGNLGNYSSLDEYTCSVLRDFRVTCGQVNINQSDCEDIKCCFDVKSNECYHFIPSKYSYQYDSKTKTYKPMQPSTPFGGDSTKELHLSVVPKSANKMIISLSDQEKNKDAQDDTYDGESNYIVNLSKNELMLEVYTRNKKDLLFSTVRGPVIASDKYWEWTIFLTDKYLFGMDRTLLHFDASKTKKGANITRVLYPNRNDHHPMPVFWAHKDGRFHSVKIKHTGPLEMIVQSSQLIVLRGLVLDTLELELSMGVSPRDMCKENDSGQYLPPRWALGAHICRKGNTLSVNSIVKNFKMDPDASSYCIDENVIMAIIHLPKTKYISKVQALMNQIVAAGRKLIFSVPPQIPTSSTLYQVASDLGILYMNHDEIYVGEYLDMDVAYPDYSHPDIQKYLLEFHNFLNDVINSNISGFILNDNWPVDDSFKIEDDDFPYLSKSMMKAMSGTLPWYTHRKDNKADTHLKLHNTYGYHHLKAFKDFHKDRLDDIVIMSTSETFGVEDPEVMDNVETSWDNLRYLLDNLLFHSITGNHLVSLPVCGDTDNFDNEFQETLCIRWYYVAATMPLLRISSVQPYREPSSLKTKFAEKFTRNAISMHRMFEGYFYTLLSQGEPVIRPMFYDYYQENTTFFTTNQYMMGPDLLVAHPLTESRRKLPIYLPKREQVWYEFWGGEIYYTDKQPWKEIDVRETDFLLFIIQGRIIALTDGDQINIVAALDTKTEEAEGSLLLDNGIWNFKANITHFWTEHIEKNDCKNRKLGDMRLLSPDKGATYIKLNINLCDV